jgi:hypothetical protein
MDRSFNYCTTDPSIPAVLGHITHMALHGTSDL